MDDKNPSDKITVSVCAGTGGVAAGGLKVLERFREVLKESGVNGDVKQRAHKVGCRGFCAKDVLVDIEAGEEIFTYQFVTPEMVPKIVEDHIMGGTPVRRWLVGEDYQQFHGSQEKVLLAHCGHIDPESIDDFLRIGGYEAAERALRTGPDEVIEILKNSGLRGRGGAGFPTGLKWESCRKADGDIKYVLCNADEGDPGAFMDRSVIEGNPHSVIEGMIIGAHAIGASQGYIYIRAEYPLAVDRLRIALDQAEKKGFLGDHVFETDSSFRINIFLGAGAFVCGEETALIASIEDKPGEPKLKYVFPTEKGLWDRPTAINNVETWANVPLIFTKGAEWYAGIGGEKSKGTKIFSLVGKINNTGLVEVPMGTPLRRIIYDIGGGVSDGKKLKAVQMGGPSGGCIPADLIDTPVDYESIARVGSIIGSGGMIVLDEDSCMVDVAKYFVSFCADESCGQCTPCREGVKTMERILTDISEGRGREEHLKQLEDLSEIIIDSSLCGLGKTAPNPVKSTLKYFADEYLAHIRDKRCPAGVCKGLVPAQCQRACPAGIDVPSYVALIAHGRYKEAVEVIRENNPFPWVCGLVCPAPCEGECQRGTVDKPISIRALKGFAAKYAMEKLDGYETRIKTRRDERVAVVGSGPAGLSAAYYLAINGYDITVFEALPEPGGMLRVGIPEHRLPKDLLDREIDHIKQMGVKIKTNTPIGAELTIDQLFERGFSAVFLGIGAHRPLSLGLANEDAEGVVQGVVYLRKLNLGESVPLGKKVIVIGGGNVAIDVARSAVRKGADEVIILYRRTRREMPAYAQEIEEALEEGISISYLSSPESILVNQEKVVGVRCIRMKLGEPDASGRRRPIPIQGSEYDIEADLIIPAIGQTTDSVPFADDEGLRWSARGTMEVDSATFATGRKGIFAGGDAATGPATVIEAIAAGKKAAVFIDAFIRGVDVHEVSPPPAKRMRLERIEVNEEKAAQLKRPDIPLIPLDQRKSTFKQVEKGLTEKMARDEGMRCLRCDLA